MSLAVTGTGSFTNLVSLALSALPTGVTASFSSAQIAPGANGIVTLAVASTVAAGSYPFTVTGER